MDTKMLTPEGPTPPLARAPPGQTPRHLGHLQRQFVIALKSGHVDDRRVGIAQYGPREFRHVDFLCFVNSPAVEPRYGLPSSGRNAADPCKHNAISDATLERNILDNEIDGRLL